MHGNGRQDPDQRLTGLATAVSARAPDGEADLQDPSLYLNRELSWLDFNERVLQLAEDEQLPLLERVKFCAIYTTNLDEFYMVRVAGLHDQIDAGVERPGQDGLTPAETIALIRERTLALGERLTECFERRLRPALADTVVHELTLPTGEYAGHIDRCCDTQTYNYLPSGFMFLVPFNKDIYKLIKAGLVSKADGLRFSPNPQQLEMNLKGIFIKS